MQRFGKYEVIEQIGVGGFGEVFKAFDPDIKRNLAIKTCTSRDQTVRDRFYQEAKIAGNLDHPNITTVYDFGVEGEVPYLAQELLTGDDLDRLIARDEQIPLARKLGYLRQIASGLEFAHSRGVVHRDVKPANIHVLKRGSVKILDFGIARLMNEDLGLTKTGTTVGTAAYLAPEQVQGEEIDQRTDIFSFGVVAYELLSTQKPFRGETFTSVIYKILSTDPEPLRDRVPECPKNVAAVIARCLEKDPEDRFSSCSEILSELPTEDELASATMDLAERAVTAPPAPADRHPRAMPLWAWPAGALLLAGSALALYLLAEARRGGATVSEPESIAAVTPKVLETSTETPPAVDEPSSLDPATEDLSPSRLGFDDDAEEIAEEEGPTAQEAVLPTQEPPPAARPAPQAGATLTVARSWSDNINVSVDGGPRRPLIRERRWELSAGRHHLLFRLESLEYTTVRELTVQLAPAEELTIATPIERPGRLRVQHALGTPQALVSVGDNRVGHSPLDALLDPGNYAIVIQPLSGGYNSQALDVELASEAWLVVTFDLTGKAETLFEAREAPEG